MSVENVETVRDLTNRFTTSDRESWRKVLADDVIWDLSATRFAEGVYEGHSGVECFFTDWLGAWEHPTVEHLEMIDAGDSAVVVFRWAGRDKASGVETEATMFGVHDVKDGRVVRYRQYDTRKEALEAAGLSE